MQERSKFSKKINISPDKFIAYIGGAGYGKSTKLKEIYQQNPSVSLILTPTLLLKLSYEEFNVKTFQKYIHPSNINKGFEQYEILLIDEYTMTTQDEFNKILQICVNLKKCYLFGDNKQLLNINHSLINLKQFKVIELTTNYRQLCPILQNNLNNTRDTGDISFIQQYFDIKNITINDIILSPTNEEIDRINNECFELNNNPLLFNFKINTPISFETSTKDYIKGESGIIIDICDKFYHIKKSNNIIIKLLHKKSKSIKLYYSTTYYKFQGQNVKDKNIILNLKDINKFSKDDQIRMKYVATSRVIKLEQLFILI